MHCLSDIYLNFPGWMVMVFGASLVGVCCMHTFFHSVYITECPSCVMAGMWLTLCTKADARLKISVFVRYQ